MRQYCDYQEKLDADGKVVRDSQGDPIVECVKMGASMTLRKRLITSMYYALTTLSTVGYGDFYPSSIAEKVAGSII